MKIANISLENPFILAPLAGITDAPVRLLAHEQGAAMVYSEMVSCKGLYYKDKNTERLLTLLPGEGPAAFQLFGCEPEMLQFASRELAPRDNVSLDINMGCPVPKVVKNGEGSAILKNPGLAGELVAAAIEGARQGAEESGKAAKPVTVKIRMGFSPDDINAVTVARSVEHAGAAAVALHGRTREQYYSGQADWDIIRTVRESVNIPVIGNGDVFSGEDALAMMAHTGCDIVMIARGALGRPWIFGEARYLWEQLGRPDGVELMRQGTEKVRKACREILGGMADRPAWMPDRVEKVAMMERHLNLSLDFKGEYAAVREMRKHVGWYLKGEHGSASLRRAVNEITDAEELRRAIRFLLEV